MKPLTLSAHEVRAVLDGTKTQHWAVLNARGQYVLRGLYGTVGNNLVPIPKYSPGDQIWVREACYIAPVGWTDSPVNPKGAWRQEVAYIADDRSGYTKEAARDYGLKLRGAVTMPRWASRITLDVTGVRVCRVQDVTSANAIASGFPAYANSATIDSDTPDPRDDFKRNWIARHGPASWDANDWCAVVDFERRG